MITREQTAMARAGLGWSRKKLADEASLAERTVIDFERGARQPHANNLLAIRNALEAAGVEIIDENGGGPGVRLAQASRV